MANKTDITTSAAANAAIINAPDSQLDAAIGDLATLTTTPKTSVVAAIGTTALTTTAKTLSGAISEIDGHADAANAAIGTIANLTDGAADLVASDNLLHNFALFGGANMAYRSGGAITWNPTTKVAAFTGSCRVLHGSAAYAATIITPGSIDFSAIATGHGVAYIPGVVYGTTQTFSAGDVVVGAYESLGVTLQNRTVIVLGVYTVSTGAFWTPFILDQIFPMLNTADSQRLFGYRAGFQAAWDPATKILSFTNSLRIRYGNNTVFGLTSVDPIDFSSVGAGLVGVAYIVGVIPGTSQTFAHTDVVVETEDSLTHTLDNGAVIIARYHQSTDQIECPFLGPLMQTEWLATKANGREKRPWVDNTQWLADKLPAFFAKLTNPSVDVRILLWGDSIFARETHTSAGAIDPTALPPCLITKNFAWYLWQYSIPNHLKAVYKRYDFTGGYFTEIGSWATSSTDPQWDDATYRPGLTRLSAPVSGAVGSVSWTLGTSDGESGCNLIIRTDTLGDTAAPITVAQGDGYLELYNGSSWVEANAATVDFSHAAAGTRTGNTTYQVRVKLRKAIAHVNATVGITVSRATADTDRLMYWGVELYDSKGGQVICQLVNVARGSHTLNSGAHNLYDYMDDEVTGFAPDLIVFEIPLINMMAGGQTKADNLASVQDVIWGDRGGHTNSWNLKTASSDWADYQVLAVIPHFTQATFTSGGAWDPSHNWQDVHNSVKALVASKLDVPVIDMGQALLHEIEADPLYSDDYYAATDTSSASGTTFLDDATHPNDKGTMAYARNIHF